MKKITCATVLAGATLVGLLAAGPATAAPVTAPQQSPSSSSPRADADGVHVDEVVRQFDQHVMASYRIAGGKTGDTFYIWNHTTGDGSQIRTFNDKGVGLVYNLQMKAGVVNDVRIHVLEAGAAWGVEKVIDIPLDDTRTNFPAPTAVAVPDASGEKFHIEFTGTPNAGVRLALANGGPMGSVLKLDKDGHASYDFDTPDHETQYDVFQYFEGVNSAPGQLTLGKGIGAPSPEAPTAEVTGTTSKGEAMVKVEGSAGNTTTLRDREGKVVAVKMIGKNGSAQLTVPGDDSYVVRQAHDKNVVSSADTLVVD